MEVRNFKLYDLPVDIEKAILNIIPFEIGYLDQDLSNCLKNDFDEQIISVSKHIKNCEMEHKAVKNAADNIAERAKELKKEIDFYKNYIIYKFEKNGLLDPIKSIDLGKIRPQNNPPKLIIDNPEIIPDTYKITEEIQTIDEKRLKCDLLEGFEIDGARIFRGKHLSIK